MIQTAVVGALGKHKGRYANTDQVIQHFQVGFHIDLLELLRTHEAIHRLVEGEEYALDRHGGAFKILPGSNLTVSQHVAQLDDLLLIFKQVRHGRKSGTEIVGNNIKRNFTAACKQLGNSQGLDLCGPFRALSRSLCIALRNLPDQVQGLQEFGLKHGAQSAGGAQNRSGIEIQTFDPL